jgi:hypothetical protein
MSAVPVPRHLVLDHVILVSLGLEGEAQFWLQLARPRDGRLNRV